MARKLDQAAKTEEKQGSLWGAFWGGFFWPFRLLWRGLSWLSHRPPLKQIGKALSWFFHLKAVRVIGRILGLSYLRTSWHELKEVTWPSFRESRRLTTAVISFAVVFGVVIYAVDWILDKIFKQILIK